MFNNLVINHFGYYKKIDLNFNILLELEQKL